MGQIVSEPLASTILKMNVLFYVTVLAAHLTGLPILHLALQSAYAFLICVASLTAS
jgi:hypothetical protein